MHFFAISVIVVASLWSAWLSHSFVILSEQDTIQVINGVQHTLTTMTVALGPDDEGLTQTINIVDPVSGNTSTISLTHEAPKEIYAMILEGFIPAFARVMDNKILLSDSNSPYNQFLNSPSVVHDNLAPSSNYVSHFVKDKNFHNRKFVDPHDNVVPRHLKNSRHPHAASETRKQRTLRDNQQKWLAVTRDTSEETAKSLKRIEDALEKDASAAGKAVTAGAKSWGQWGKDLFSGALSTAVGMIAYSAACYGLTQQGAPNWLQDVGSVICGSGGGDAAALSDLQNQITALQQDVDGINVQLVSLNVWKTEETQVTDSLVQQNGFILGQFDYIKADLRDLQNQISSINQAIFLITANYAKDFSAIANEFTAEQLDTQALYNYTSAIASTTSQQIQMLAVNAATVEQRVKQLIMQVVAIYKRLAPRRALIYSFWNNTVNFDYPIPTCVFAQCMGLPPLPYSDGSEFTYDNAANCPTDPAGCSFVLDQVVGTNSIAPLSASLPPTTSSAQSLYYAGQLSLVRLQYTTGGSPNIAVERQISYLCDKRYYLNNVMSYVTISDLFHFLGPPSINDTLCYDPADPTSGTWNCSCVIVQQIVSCPLNNDAPMFPFGWKPTSTLKGSNQTATYCSSPVTTSSIGPETANVATQLNSQGTVFSTISNWYAFMTAFCQNSLTWSNWTDNRNLRLSADQAGGYVDLTINPNFSSIPSFCDPSFENIGILPDQLDRLAYNLYSLWVRSYTAVSSILGPYWEAQIFGALPTGPRVTKDPFGSRPDIMQTADAFNLPILKYAGTGIGVSLPYSTPNPDQSLISATYPPSPIYTTPPYPNTNKLPVYLISPVESSYSPTISLSINGGPASTCVINGSACTLPVSGTTNFTSVLSTVLTADWTNLLPKERYIVGSYSYDLGVQQVIFDVPESLLPLSYSRESQCNKLLYLFQPRNSNLTNNTLFNIPDTDFLTPISGADWASWYRTDFDAMCATESAMDYARTVDANGLCIGGVNPDGTPANNVSSNGYFDMCTLLQAYRMIVPNPVTAFMYLEPRYYTNTVTFTVPKGQVIQYVSTSCPSGYQILKPSGTEGNTEVVFTTTNPATQKITIVVTQFAPCSNLSPFTLSYSASNPAVYANIPNCGQQYVNVYPYLSDAACYPYPGLEMYAATSSNSAPGVPSSVVLFAQPVFDQTVNQLVNLMIDLSVLQAQAMSIPYISSSIDDADARYQANAEQQSKAVAALNVTGVSDQTIKDTYEETYKQINNSSAEVIANLAKQEQIMKAAYNLSNFTAALNAAADEASNKVSDGQAKLNQLIADNDAYINAQRAKFYHDLNSGSSGCAIAWLGLQFLCDLWDGATSIFQNAIRIIILVIVVTMIGCCISNGCCTKCCKCLCRMCNPKHKSFQQAYDSDGEEEEEEEKVERPAKQKAAADSKRPNSKPQHRQQADSVERRPLVRPRPRS